MAHKGALTSEMSCNQFVNGIYFSELEHLRAFGGWNAFDDHPYDVIEYEDGVVIGIEGDVYHDVEVAEDVRSLYYNMNVYLSHRRMHLPGNVEIKRYEAITWCEEDIDFLFTAWWKETVENFVRPTVENFCHLE